MAQTIILIKRTTIDSKLSDNLPISDVQIEEQKDTIKVTGLPDEHMLEYVAKTPESEYVVIHGPKENSQPKQFKVAFGKPGYLKEGHVTGLLINPMEGTKQMKFKMGIQRGLVYYFHPDKEKGSNLPFIGYADKTRKLETIFIQEEEHFFF